METNISLPKAPKLVKQVSPRRAVLEIEDLYPGYGLTMGNALRRAMLSSLPGSAITSVKIKGANHEFSTLPGIREDIVEIILNLKQIRFKMHGDEPQILTLKAKGEKEVTAGDIQKVSQAEIINPEAHIADLTSKSASLEIEIKVERGLGYSTIESRKQKKQEVGAIVVDAVFSPVKMVNFKVEDMRVGEITNYNRLIFDIETDGAISPGDALKNAANLLIQHFQIITSMTQIKTEEEKETQKTEKKPDSKKPEKSEPEKNENGVNKMKIEDLKLSGRTQNILLSNRVKTVAGLLQLNQKNLLDFKDLGEKALKEIKKALGKLGLTLKQE